MPELPEIEHLRRTLAPSLIGARVLRVHLRRRDVVRQARSRKPLRGARARDLLGGTTIVDIDRRGKSLALVADNGRVLALHMGMTGSMTITGRDGAASPRKRDHVHCEWTLRSADGRPMVMRFRDPRRFGGLWPFASMEEVRARAWSRLGPDALSINARTLRQRLSRSRQPIKAALLNQALIAGVGNIYADEALFAARIHPRRWARALDDADWPRLAKAIRQVLRKAVRAGGSSIRDYVDSNGSAGAFVTNHRVYGRAGLECICCREALSSTTLAQRTTVFCKRCQPL